MKSYQVPRDDRTTERENAGYRWAYMFLAFGILLSVAYRGLVLQQASWDLLALVVLSGGVATLYHGFHHGLSWRWLRMAVLAILIAAIISVAFVLAR